MLILFWDFWCTGAVVLEALVLTAAVVLSLLAYTHWAARRGHDFSFLGPILFTSLMIVLLFGFIQVCSSTLSSLLNFCFDITMLVFVIVSFQYILTYMC